MGKILGILILALCALICEAAIFRPISDSHRSAALELLTPKDGSFTSLKETYEALRTFKVLGIGHQFDIKAKSCKSVVDTVGSPSSTLKDLFQALEVNGILKCELSKETFAGITSRLKDSVNTASSLLDYYYSIGSLVLIKGQTSEVDVHLGGADSVFRAIKALSQSDGRWRYSSNNPESSTFAAGIALESLAGVISLASSEIDHSLISLVKNDISKLLDGVEKYDDGAYYFDEKLVDAHGHQSPLSASSAVVRGITAFATASDEDLNLRFSFPMAIAAARSIFRSPSLRNAASRIASEAKAARSPLRTPSKSSLSHRIFRCPSEMSACLESLQPYHTVTASALMTSMLTDSLRSYSWLSEAQNEDV